MNFQGHAQRRFQSLMRPNSDRPEIPVDKSIKPEQVYVYRYTPPPEPTPGPFLRSGFDRQVKTPALAPLRVRLNMRSGNSINQDSGSDEESLQGDLRKKQALLLGGYSDDNLLHRRIRRKHVSFEDEVLQSQQSRKGPSLRQVRVESKPNLLASYLSRKDGSSSDRSHSRVQRQHSVLSEAAGIHPSHLYYEETHTQRPAYKLTIRALHCRLAQSRVAQT